MNDTNTVTVTATAPEMFTRFCTDVFVKSCVKEARRVKYKVIKNGSFYTINDGTEVVMTAFKYNRTTWVVRFSSLYWNDVTNT